MSGTIEPMPVSVRSTAPNPAQPGKPAFSTMRHAIQAASTVPTMAKKPVRPKKWSRPAISRPMVLAPLLLRFAIRPAAESQHRHDNEGADNRHEVEQRQRAGKPCPLANPPCRYDQQQ